jgi:type IV pilus assembly protein PilY1
MQNIESRIGSAASVSVNGDELYGLLGADVRMYQSSYSSDGWIGDVKAYALDPTTGDVITTAYVFSAAAELENQDPNSRIIATYDGSSAGTPFRFGDLTTAQKNLLVEGGETDYTAAANRLDYIRGDTSLEERYGGPLRSRYQRLGDIVHSSPVFENGVLYAGGNDGMLHAIDASDGRELFAYVPNLVFENLKELTKPTYAHRFYVDLTPTVKSGVKVGSDTITMLVGGLGKGGKGYYALDVTDPFAITNETALSAKVLGEYPQTGPVATITGATNASPIVITATDHGFDPGHTVVVKDVGGNTAANGNWTITYIDDDSFSLNGSTGNGAYTSGGIASFKDPDSDDLGYSYSKPAIVMSNDSDRWLVIFGNGYNSYNGHAVLFIVDAASGTLLRKIDTEAGNCNGLSTPVAIDINFDQRVDYVYAGDLQGNLWKFDLTSNNVLDWDVAFDNSGTPKPLFQATDGVLPQPITAKPDVMFHCENEGLMVVFGTGRYLGDSDFLDNSLQSIYGIWDYGDDDDSNEYLGSFERGSVPQLSNQPNSVTLLQQTELPGNYFTASGQSLRILTAYAPDWQTTTEDGGGNCASGVVGVGITDCDPDSVGLNPDPVFHAGWYFDLPVTGERAPNNLMIRDKKAVVIGFIPENTPCGAGGNSYVMEMDACSGGRLTSPQFDINGDGKVDSNDMVALTDASGNPLTDAHGNPILVVPTGMMYPGRLLPPAILKTGDEEIKYFSTNVGSIVTMRERGVPLGIIYWLEVIP